MFEIRDPLGLERPNRPIPKKILAMMAGLAIAAFFLTLASARTGMGRVPVAQPSDIPVDVIEVSFAETADGVIQVVRHPDGEVLLELADGEGGFMRGVLRPLRRERMRHGESAALPYTLTRHRSGALTLTDESTDLVVDIAAFGATSVAYFARLFTDDRADS